MHTFTQFKGEIDLCEEFGSYSLHTRKFPVCYLDFHSVRILLMGLKIVDKKGIIESMY